jgi:GMP synthase (glutamine-hydrolysing)
MQTVQAAITSMDHSAARVLYCLSDEPREGPLIVAVRAIESKDFVRARVTNVPWKILRSIESEVMASCPNVSSVYFDITPKPPSSIEFE